LVIDVRSGSFSAELLNVSNVWNRPESRRDAHALLGFDPSFVQKDQAMENEERTRKKLKHIAAGHKASETKGPAERSRAAKAAAWTKKHGKDNAQNPFARKPPPPRS
jgi:hypothetical protein